MWRAAADEPDRPAPRTSRAAPAAGRPRLGTTISPRLPRRRQDPRPRRPALPDPARPSPGGQSLLSFTNVASDELRDRCSGNRPDLTAFPHFIGTFDSFLWRYLVRPFLPATRPGSTSCPGTTSRPSSARARYRCRPSASATTPPPGRPQCSGPPQPGPGQVTTVRSGLPPARPAAARRPVAAPRLYDRPRGPHRRPRPRRNPSVTHLLRHRFIEIVVDEAQDCSNSTSPSSSSCTEQACPWSSSPIPTRASTNGTTHDRRTCTPSPCICPPAWS
ncbi:hypothetical protein ACFQ60_00040 [Streptomyces zhihengii]